MSIPLMELTAAVVSVNVTAILERELDNTSLQSVTIITISESVYTDLHP